MREEVLVFGRNEGLDDMQRDRLVRHEDAVLVGEFGDQGTVAGVHARGDRRFILFQLGDRWHVAPKRCEIDPERDQAENAEHHTGDCQPDSPFQPKRKAPFFLIGVRPAFGLEGRRSVVCHL